MGNTRELMEHKFCDSASYSGRVSMGEMQCKECISNQNHSTPSRAVSKSLKNNCYINKTMTRMSLWTTFIVIWISIISGVTEGLQCYECLSLYCDSGAVCDAIKNTMVEIFVPKRHFIHFDPSDICPEDELPSNSTRWANLSRQCERSDSLCLVSPIEVHTVVDGKKHGKKLENEYTLTTFGNLRGCASRRKLLEFPETINVRIEFIGRNESSGNSRVAKGVNGNSPKNNNVYNPNDSSGMLTSSPSGKLDKGVGNDGKKTEIFYNMSNIAPGAEFDPSKKTYEDGYTIMKIYSHVFYIDQGTQNATKCYEDNCNDKVKLRMRYGSGVAVLSSSSIFFIVIICSLNFILM
ncbi:unnamed protein product [Orchesella dallaii]|uniref:Uncharacterized protein n=1 Tax=Orchesella dallaii TaxID=48710 RepID=A0ABP1QRZ3_9HEXA